jgi:fructose 1,6-bisphosphate aldolase/phosphatase
MSVVVSIFKACAGGYVGAGGVHPALIDAARESLSQSRETGRVRDGFVARCGDDIALVLLHDDADAARTLAERAFEGAREVGVRLAQHAAKGDGRHEIESVELSLRPRSSEPVLCFLSDKAGPGAWNVHLYRMFGDPFNTPSLVTDPELAEGFRFEVGNGERKAFDLPGELYAFLRAAGTEGRVVREVISRATGEVVAAASAGPDPAFIVRCEAPFPTVGEVLEAFAFPYAVAGWLGADACPLMPVSTNDEASSRSGGPPRAIGLGFQVTDERLVGPRDLLGDAAFEDVRRQALSAAEYLRRHGPFAPQRAVDHSLL